MYLGSPQITKYFVLFDLFPEECCWLGLDRAPSGTREHYRIALRDINGDASFTQPPLKVVEFWPQVAEQQRLFAGRGYDGRVVNVEEQLDVVRGWSMSLTHRMKRTKEINSP